VAVLLETAASGDKDYLPPYGHTLSQLTVQEARFLSSFWVWATDPESPVLGMLSDPRQSVTARQLLSVFHPDIHMNLVLAYSGPAENAPPEVRSVAIRQAELDHILDDLVRLGLFEIIRREKPRVLLQFGEHKIPTGDGLSMFQESFALPLYGQKFLRAVTQSHPMT